MPLSGRLEVPDDGVIGNIKVATQRFPAPAGCLHQCVAGVAERRRAPDHDHGRRSVPLPQRAERYVDTLLNVVVVCVWMCVLYSVWGACFRYA